MNINKTLIINVGLSAGGSKKIFSPSDDSKSARLTSTLYDFCRSLVFDMPIDWRWCMARSEALAQLTDPPTGFDHQYGPLPDNTIRPVAMIDESRDEIEYTFEAGLLIEAGTPTKITQTLQTDLNATEVFIKYIVFIEDEAMYPAWFTQLISLNIALYTIEPLKQHTPLYTKIKDMLAKAELVAEQANALWNAKTDGAGRNLDKGSNDVINAPLGVAIAENIRFVKETN